MVELELLQTASYLIAALSFAVTCTYYIMNLRNAEREKRRQTLLMRMPAMNKDWYESYWYNYFKQQGNYTEEEWNKITNTPE